MGLSESAELILRLVGGLTAATMVENIPVLIDYLVLILYTHAC